MAGKSDLLHIRVGKEMKKHMQHLIEIGMFSTEAEIAREGIRAILFKYKDEEFITERKKNAKK